MGYPFNKALSVNFDENNGSTYPKEPANGGVFQEDLAFQLIVQDFSLKFLELSCEALRFHVTVSMQTALTVFSHT